MMVAAAGLVGVLLVGLVVVPGMLSAKAQTWLDEAIASSVDADITYGDLGISALRAFPRVTISVDNVKVTGRETFAGVDLLTADEVTIAVNALSLLGGPVKIRKLKLVHPVLDLRVDPKGRENRDIFGDGESSDYAVDLDSVEVVDLALRWADVSTGLGIRIADLDLEADGAVTQDLAQFNTRAAMSGLDLRYGGVNWLMNADGKGDLGFGYDQGTGAMTFEDAKLALNALPLAISGSLIPAGDEYEVDVAFSAPDADFKSLLSLVPAAYGESFEGVEASGSLALEGSSKGTYSEEELPAFDLTLQVKDAAFKYPDLPTAVSEIRADMQITHAQGPADLTEIDVRDFSLSTAGAPFGGSARIRNPSTDPDVEANVKGRLDLGVLRSALPDTGAPPAEGKVDVDLAFSGLMSDFQEQRTEKVTASGTFAAKDLRLDSESLPVVLLIQDLDAALAADRVEIRTLTMRYDDSDLTVSGQLDNVLPYLLADEALTGDLDLKAGKLDLRPFQGEEDQPKNADEGVLVAIPANVGLGMSAEIDHLVTTLFELTEVESQVAVRDSALRMESFDARMAGGEVSLTGKYSAPTAESADVDLKIDTLRFDLVETLKTFETLRMIAPVLQGATGRFDSGFAVETRLDAQGNPDLSLVSSAGNFIPLDLKLKGSALEQAAKQIKGLDTLNLDGAFIRYAFEKGAIALRPFTAKLGDMPATVSGQAGVLDQSLDLKVDVAVPTKILKGSPILAATKDVLGKKVDVLVKIGGTWTKPKVSVGLAGGLKDEAAELVGAGLEEARAAGEALLAEAQAGADLLREEAKKAGDVLRAEAKKAGKKLKKQAGDNAIKKALAVEGAKKLNSEADKAAKKLVRESNKAAKKLIAEAETRADQLLDEASKASKKALK